MGLGTLRQEVLHYVSLIFVRDDPLWSWLRKEITGIIDQPQLKEFAATFKELARMLAGQKVIVGKFKEWIAPDDEREPGC